ncbi:MAG TPA: hypothetical protein VI341_07730 [Actinomycetota bacterium]
MQRRIREVRRDRMAKAMRAGRPRRTLRDLLLGREAGTRPPAIDLDAEAFIDRGTDVWKSLRF